MRALVMAALVVASGFTLAACDAFGSDGGEARMTVRLTDAPFPFDLADSANVTITRIELRASGGADDTTAADSADGDRDVLVLFDAEADGGPMAFNLLDLRDGVTATLVDEVTIPADGGYDQVRVFVGEDASVVFSDGRVFGLKLPSASQSGLKIQLPQIHLDGEGEEIDLLLDFDVEQSFVMRGNLGTASFNGFLFKPVIEVESFEVVAETEVEADSTEAGTVG